MAGGQSRGRVRVQLRPGLRRLWRDESTLQLGLSPAHGVVLTGLHEGDDLVLAALDGTRDLDELREVARSRSVPPERVTELVRLLARADVLVTEPSAEHPSGPSANRVHLGRLGRSARQRLAPDSDTWALLYGTDGLTLLARRAGQRVLVDGAGRLGAAIGVTLASAGIGTVDSDDDDPVRDGDVLAAGHDRQDVGSSRSFSLARSVDRVVRPVDPEQDDVPTRLRDRPPDLVVVVRDDVVEPALADRLERRGLAHLAVVTAADRVVVGPLVLPGIGPCLRCLDLHRRDRDPAWPHLSAQLVAGRRSAPSRGESASATAAAGLAALQVLAFLDGRTVPVTHGRTLDLLLPDGLLERRRWSAHPACGCSRLPETGSSTGSGMQAART